MNKELQKTIDSAMNGNRPKSIQEAAGLFLQKGGVRYSIYQDSPIPDATPLLVVANHFCRPIIQVGEIPLIPNFAIRNQHVCPTTLESAAMVSLAVVAISEVSARTIVPIVNADINSNPCFPSQPRAMQQEVLNWFPVIRVSKSHGMGALRNIWKQMDAGNNILIFPEGKPSYGLAEYNPNFENIFHILRKINYKVVPTAIFYDGRQYVIHVRDSITPGTDPLESARAAMFSIASSLPRRMRGVWQQ